MAGTIKANALQLGDSATAANNFVLQTNTDGTAKLSRGNLGATTQDILTVDAAGKHVTSLMPFVGTAPIVENGSNANGLWSKWADGTMICRGGYGGSVAMQSYINGLYYGAFTVTFPVAFVDLPTMLVGTAGDQATNGWCSGGNSTNTTSGMVYWTRSATVSATNISWAAIGRWK